MILFLTILSILSLTILSLVLPTKSLLLYINFLILVLDFIAWMHHMPLNR